MKTKRIVLLLIGVSIILGGFFLAQSKDSSSIKYKLPQVALGPLWEYQCVDTMKSSRDRARAWIGRKDLKDEIKRQMQSISSMGASCVSIGTPYDEEFVPYLRAWVEGARSANLKVWFRGNLSGWEGWFDYPRIRSEEEHVKRTGEFIRNYPDLFEDGDIFTPAPEAENGGPFNAGQTDQYGQYRKFLTSSYAGCLTAFNSIRKSVTCNWFSMSGGHAKGIFTPEYIKEVGNIVTIDHYVRDTRDMGEFIDYFTSMKSKVVLGEFGGPIPDLNGDMNEEEQAVLVRSVLKEMFERRDHIVGVNYWTLMEGSTKLLNDDYTERPVVNVIRDYYKPGVLIGQVVSKEGNAIQNALIKFDSFPATLHTDEHGYFSIALPSGAYSFDTVVDRNMPVRTDVFVPRSEKVSVTITLR